jgi:NAD-dependent SIR2 family protein deacetylase
MPLYDFECRLGHTQERYIVSHEEAIETVFHCPTCLAPARYAPVCLGKGLVWFEEGRPRTFYNLGDKPVTVTSRAEHRRAMKAAGVVEAGNRRGEKGVWI